MFFFFQAEDGIRDTSVTGVQTCALPICLPYASKSPRLTTFDAYGRPVTGFTGWPVPSLVPSEIGRASCRERLKFKLAASAFRMNFPILASLLVRLVVLVPVQLLRLSL